MIVPDNALKHSAGVMHIAAERKGALVEIRVQDFGDGMPPEKLERLFDRFYRGDDSTALPGFGLGLSIAKTLVEGQGGEIRMESQLGKSSTMILTLPSAAG